MNFKWSNRLYNSWHDNGWTLQALGQDSIESNPCFDELNLIVENARRYFIDKNIDLKSAMDKRKSIREFANATPNYTQIEALRNRVLSFYESVEVDLLLSYQELQSISDKDVLNSFFWQADLKNSCVSILFSIKHADRYNLIQSLVCIGFAAQAALLLAELDGFKGFVTHGIEELYRDGWEYAIFLGQQE